MKKLSENLSHHTALMAPGGLTQYTGERIKDNTIFFVPKYKKVGRGNFRLLHFILK